MLDQANGPSTPTLCHTVAKNTRCHQEVQQFSLLLPPSPHLTHSGVHSPFTEMGRAHSGLKLAKSTTVEHPLAPRDLATWQAVLKTGQYPLLIYNCPLFSDILFS
ncbi:UNVERIFIED_CONTAM: hypothetical protein K2H54_074423 [Gekko kuhli]